MAVRQCSFSSICLLPLLHQAEELQRAREEELIAEQKRRTEEIESEAAADAEARAQRQKEREEQLAKILEVSSVGMSGDVKL